MQTYKEWKEKKRKRVLHGPLGPGGPATAICPPIAETRQAVPTSTPMELSARARTWLHPRLEATRRNAGKWTLFPVVVPGIIDEIDDIQACAVAAGYLADVRDHFGNWSLTMKLNQTR